MRADAVEPAARVVQLHSEGARDRAVTGGKAANLARAAAAGLPVLPGFALVPDGRVRDSAVRRAWQDLAGADGTPLAVRSSSCHEDTETSSMAGRFRTVLDVRGWDAFTDAVAAVLESAAPNGQAHQWPPAAPPPGPVVPDHPTPDGMAVLVQPMLRPAAGGVMFGADPVSGRRDRIVVSAVRGGPAVLVDGTAQGERYELSRAGRLLDGDRAPEPVLTRRRLRRLAQLARRTRELFGAPQDIEFAFDENDRLWLLQSRPITAMAPRPPDRRARLLGPGPVAETFPDVLQPLEEDLWIAPMAHGLTLALDTLGAASRRVLRDLPPVVTIGGRVAADLRLLGVEPPTHRYLRLLNPVPAARQACVAWRIGRLRATLPSLALDLVADVDRQLAAFPAPDDMSAGEMLAAAGWGRRVLSALHAQESLAGALLGAENEATVAGEALATLAEARAAGHDDAALPARHPVLLALFPPSLTRPGRLPAPAAWTGVPRGVAALPVREGLRLRIRWVQEMQAVMARAYAARLTAVGLPGDAERIGLLRWHELLAVADGARPPDDLAERTPRPDRAQLPTRFRLVDGRPVAEPPRGHHAGGGQGAGGGTGTGTAWDGRAARPEHAVLVVGVLDPGLAPLLPGLAGLVAETGSPLSHLAVLSREHGIPAATAVPDALARFPTGTDVTVDGTTGTVERHPTGPPAPNPDPTPATPPPHTKPPPAPTATRPNPSHPAAPDDFPRGGPPC